MTVVSLALAMGALGVLIRNQPARGRSLRSQEASPGAWQTLARSVVLLVVLNLFDLACTLLALRTGGLLELNPLAPSAADGPLPMAAFKLVLVALTCGVMLTFWRYRLAQLASWWSSALYTVLTIRWATYNSFFLY